MLRPFICSNVKLYPQIYHTVMEKTLKIHNVHNVHKEEIFVEIF